MSSRKINDAFQSYLNLTKKIERFEKEREKVKEFLKQQTALHKNKVLDFQRGGCLLQEAIRETLDKWAVKKLIGDLQYKQVTKVTKYPIFKVYTDQEKWEAYKEKFIKEKN
jgi:hypothetical protein